VTAGISYQRELWIAILVAVWLHVLVFCIFAALLLFELIAGKVSEARESEETNSGEMTEIVIRFEEDPVPVIEVPVVVLEEEIPSSSERPKFAQTPEAQETAAPEKADFIGKKDTVASSDANAMAGDEKETALPGDQEVVDDIKVTNEKFNDGPDKGSGMKGESIGKVGEGEDSSSREKVAPTPDESKPLEKTAMVKDVPVDFVDTEGVRETLDDATVKKAPKEEVQAKVEETPPMKKEDAKVVKNEGSPQGGFQSQQSKTKVQGTLNASGKGSLNVEDSPLGRYQETIFRLIEREWQPRHFKFRVHSAPGHITIRFLVDAKGKVSGRRQVEMRGASDMQRAIILDSIQASKFPVMPIEVSKELDGEPLELNITFNY
jgi:hypothetical protein